MLIPMCFHRPVPFGIKLEWFGHGVKCRSVKSVNSAMCPKMMPANLLWKIDGRIISIVRVNIAMTLKSFVWYVDRLYAPMPVHMYSKWPTNDEHVLVDLQVESVDHLHPGRIHVIPVICRSIASDFAISWKHEVMQIISRKLFNLKWRKHTHQINCIMQKQHHKSR